MTYFKFDTKSLDSLGQADKEDAVMAAHVARELAGYYQTIAKTIVENGKKKPEEVALPQFSNEERKLASEAAVIGRSFGVNKGSKAATAAFKIFLATQMDFYRANPQYLTVFRLGNDPARALQFLEMLELINDNLSESYPQVDDYFSSSLNELKTWSRQFVKSPPPNPPAP